MIGSRLFFLALFLTLADHEVRKVLLNTEGSESCFTTVHPALLDNLGHTMEYLRGGGARVGGQRFKCSTQDMCVQGNGLCLHREKWIFLWYQFSLRGLCGLPSPPHARLTRVYHLTQN